MELDKVIALIHAVSDSKLTGLILEEGNLHLELQKVPVLKGQETGLQTVTEVKSCLEEMPQSVEEVQIQRVEEQDILREEDEKKDVVLAKEEENDTAVCSPLVGTFYCAPSEGEEPFVKVGDRVSKGQVLGIIEAMKLMNEIESERDGVISAVLVENGQIVEYGQTLFLIR